MSEREARTVIFVVKMFRVYLLTSQPFQLVTDHKLLQYLFKEKHIHGRILFYMELLTEYEFKIVYCSGANNSPAYYLSCIELSKKYPVSVYLEDSFRPNEARGKPDHETR